MKGKIKIDIREVVKLIKEKHSLPHGWNLTSIEVKFYGEETMILNYLPMEKATFNLDSILPDV